MKFEISPMQDIVFQYIFSSEGSENGLLGFINAIQESMGQPVATRVKIQHPFNLKKFKEDKQTVVDLKVQDSDGRIYDVEMQTVNHKSFLERIVYYASKLYSQQLLEGMDYSRLNPVYSIALVNFELFPHIPQLHNVFELRNVQDSTIRLTDRFQYHILELCNRKWEYFLSHFEDESWRKLPKNRIFSWVDFLLNGNQKTEAEMENITTEIPGLDTAYAKFGEFTQSEEMRYEAFLRQKAELDRIAKNQYEIDQGVQRGIALGEARGIALGEARGIALGEARKSLKAVLQVLQLRFPNDVSNELLSEISQISDVDKLDNLHISAICAGTLEDFIKNL